MKKFIVILITSLFPLISYATSGDNTSYPKSAARERWEGFGSVVGEEGGITLYNSNPNKKSFLGGGNAPSSAATMNVNPFLWQASLDVVSFMPIKSSDSAGGVISTDWYEDPEYPGTRYRLNVLVKAIELNVNNLQVRVFKQVLKEKVWREVKPSSDIAEDLEEKILTKARELKLAQSH